MLIEEVNIGLLGEDLQVDMLRIDLHDPDIPGNKFWKLKYNIREMEDRGLDTMVSFGGAYSNHISALAAAGRKYGFKSVGIIRGEELSGDNPTLAEAAKQGMELKFIDRTTYRDWKKGAVDLDEFLGMENYYLLPEGGSNALAVRGCAEILNESTREYNIICCPVGSGGTLAGLIAGSVPEQNILGFSALKGGEYLEEEVMDLVEAYAPGIDRKNWLLNHDYHFGGFASVKLTLLKTYQKFLELNNVELDLIYTVKMVYGVWDLLRSGSLDPDKRILLIHTGGQQGNASMKERYTRNGIILR